MKKLTTLALMMIFVLSAFSQGITSKDRLITELHWNGWLNAPEGIDAEWYSRGANISVMYDLQLGKSNFSIAPGVGFGFDNVYHNGFFRMDTSGVTQFEPYPDSINFDKNKLSTTYLEVPIEFRFRTNPNDKGNSIKIAIGAKGGFLISNHVKYIGEGAAFGVLSNEVKTKNYNVPNISSFRYGLTARVGYGPVNLNFFYSMSPLFDEGLGPQINPMTIGVSFNGL